MLPIRPSSPFAAPICVQLPVAKDDGNIDQVIEHEEVEAEADAMQENDFGESVLSGSIINENKPKRTA